MPSSLHPAIRAAVGWRRARLRRRRRRAPSRTLPQAPRAATRLPPPRRRSRRRPHAPTSSTGSCSATSRCSAARSRSPRARISKPRARRATRDSPAAPPRSRLPRRQRALAHGSRAAVELDRPRRRAPAADPRRARRRARAARRRRTPAASDLRARLERLLAEAATSGPGVGEVFLQLNRAFAQQSDKRAVLRAHPRSRQAVSEGARGALRRRARRVQRDASTSRRARRRGADARSTARSRCGPTGSARRC